MPKGDREILKADCEDGFTRIANLLLEALALARLNGVQKGICLFLFRRTYGWNRSEDAISLGEFAEACGSSRSYISRQLSDLIEKKYYLPGFLCTRQDTGLFIYNQCGRVEYLLYRLGCS